MQIKNHSLKKHQRRIRQLEKKLAASIGDKRVALRAEIKRTQKTWAVVWNKNNGLNRTTVRRPNYPIECAFDESFALAP